MPVHAFRPESAEPGSGRGKKSPAGISARRGVQEFPSVRASGHKPGGLLTWVQTGFQVPGVPLPTHFQPKVIQSTPFESV